MVGRILKVRLMSIEFIILYLQRSILPLYGAKSKGISNEP
ncbi:hypothetical protein ES703_85127 [subsurface metagenome]